jgi:transcriptional regulator GlxA family with amidase domain
VQKETRTVVYDEDLRVEAYRYLETIRVNQAKKLLGEGVLPVEAAVRTGFSDQSHFTNYFNSFIGLAPGAYREIFLDKKDSFNKKDTLNSKNFLDKKDDKRHGD